MAKEERFEKIYSQGALTPLLDRDGKPVISQAINR